MHCSSFAEGDIFITNFLPMNPVAQQRILEFGQFRLDASGRILFRGGRPVPLPPKAADVLVLLVQNAGKLVEKEELLTQVWRNTFVEEGSLTRTISILRKALGEDESGQDYIATSRSAATALLQW